MNDIALIGKKIGMTREFYKTGQSIPVTVIKMEKARVIDVIDKEKRGYKAIQLGFGKIKNSKLTKAMKGYFAKKNTEPKRKLKEFRVEDIENYKLGNEFGLEIFKKLQKAIGLRIRFSLVIKACHPYSARKVFLYFAFELFDFKSCVIRKPHGHQFPGP